MYLNSNLQPIQVAGLMSVRSNQQPPRTQGGPPDTLIAPTNCFPKSSATKLAVRARVATCRSRLSVLPGRSATVAVTVITSPGAGRSVRLRGAGGCQAARINTQFLEITAHLRTRAPVAASPDGMRLVGPLS